MIKKRKSILPKILLFLIALFLVLIISALQSQIKALEEERDKLAKSVKEYSGRVDELIYEGDLSEKEYIEKYAREVLGFHKSGEIVFKNSNGK